MPIHNFSPVQEKMFGAVTSNPVLSVRVETWHDEGTTRLFILKDGRVVPLAMSRRDFFFHSKKKLLYFRLDNDSSSHATDEFLEAFIKTNGETEVERLRRELREAEARAAANPVTEEDPVPCEARSDAVKLKIPVHLQQFMV